jgi:precorrin-2 dehydrogenase/sirohydrochlorin ferrochelatase
MGSGRNKSMKLAKLFPMFLKLAGRPCLVVGAGSIAESKISNLLEAQAAVRVIAPKATPKVRSWARSNQIAWQRRPFESSDLDKMFLVVAATSSAQLHKEIFREATKRGVLCNIVDVPDLCDFYYPAVVQRGALQIAISTSGQSPALAQRLRKELEEQFGPEYEQWLEQLGNSRSELQSKSLDADECKRQLHAQVSKKAFAAFLKQYSKPNRSKPKRPR